jgi:hypothetical protein
MSLEQYANDAATTLSSAITTTNGTSISVTSAVGFPSVAQYRIRIDDEIMLVTAGAGTTTQTVTRGVEGTTAATHNNGAAVVHVLTAAALGNLLLKDINWAAIQSSQLVNEIMNFPSLEKANDAQPEWWEVSGVTLTEVDILGESLTETYARGLKVVTASNSQYGYQSYVYADQPRIKSGRTVSALAAVWSKSGTNARIRLVDSSGSLVVSSTATASPWAILTAENALLSGSSVQLRLEVDSGSAYFVPLGLNIGANALPLPPRGLTYRSISGSPIIEETLSGLNNRTWADVDLSADTSNLTVRGQMNVFMLEGTAGDDFRYFVRRNGTSASNITSIRAEVRGTGAQVANNSFDTLLDDGQVYETQVTRESGTGTIDYGTVSLVGYWEWE